MGCIHPKNSLRALSINEISYSCHRHHVAPVLGTESNNHRSTPRMIIEIVEMRRNNSDSEIINGLHIVRIHHVNLIIFYGLMMNSGGVGISI